MDQARRTPDRGRGGNRITPAAGLAPIEPLGTEILDVKGAAKIRGCSVSHVLNMLNGKVDGVRPIPHVRAGRVRLIRRQALLRWFEEQEHAAREVVRR